MTNPNLDIDGWKNLPWKKFQKVVFRLQCRIYKARRNDNLQLVRKLQKLLLSSKAAKYLAVRQIIQLNSVTYRVFEMDIEKCFDSISHEAIMSRVSLPKWVKTKLWKAIKVGVKAEYPSSEKGTPQGGVISPLLANVALHGMEDLGNGLRYADDCIFVLKPNDNLDELRTKIDNFLCERGLRIKESKTRLVKTTEGFEFLGFKFLVLPDGRFKSYPTDKKHRDIKAKVKETIRDKKFQLESRIKKVSSIVRGWRNYYQYCDLEDYDLWFLQNNTWKFIRKEIRRNKKIKSKRSWTERQIKKAFPNVSYAQNRFTNVTKDLSPFNGDILYWTKRNSKLYDNHTAKALKRQNLTCGKCGLSFLGDNVIELHHKDGNHNNWKPSNLVALHKYCHQYQEIHSSSTRTIE